MYNSSFMFRPASSQLHHVFSGSQLLIFPRANPKKKQIKKNPRNSIGYPLVSRYGGRTVIHLLSMAEARTDLEA